MHIFRVFHYICDLIMKQPQILVIDDERDLCEIMQFNLSMAGYQVSTANSAHEALEMNLAQFDLLLLDVMMHAE